MLVLQVTQPVHVNQSGIFKYLNSCGMHYAWGNVHESLNGALLKKGYFLTVWVDWDLLNHDFSLIARVQWKVISSVLQDRRDNLVVMATGKLNFIMKHQLCTFNKPIQDYFLDVLILVVVRMLLLFWDQLKNCKIVKTYLILGYIRFM